MSAPDEADQPPRRAPRGRGAYLWLIEQVPDRYEPQLRDAATTVRNRRLRVRLFRERWIRRSLRSVRRSERSWKRRRRRALRVVARRRRTLRRLLLKTQRRVLSSTRRQQRAVLQTRGRTASSTQRQLRNDDSVSQHDLQVAEQLAWTPRGRIARALFPATVRLPGDGEFVAIDATGCLISEIIACQDRLPQRFLVVTDAASVGALRTAGITYEYLPTASDRHLAETFIERLLWLDYVYGVDRIERLDHYADDPPSNAQLPTIRADVDQ